MCASTSAFGPFRPDLLFSREQGDFPKGTPGGFRLMLAGEECDHIGGENSRGRGTSIDTVNSQKRTPSKGGVWVGTA